VQAAVQYERRAKWIGEADATRRVQLRRSGIITERKRCTQQLRDGGTSAGRKKQMCCKKVRVLKRKVDDQRLRFKIDGVLRGNRERKFIPTEGGRLRRASIWFTADGRPRSHKMGSGSVSNSTWIRTSGGTEELSR
jgi:hypothetical protein